MNYPNMSYCMCENTLSAMHQVLEAMQEEGPRFLQEMSRTERRAFEELFHACEAFVNQSELLQEEYENEQADGNLYEEDTL
jgi:hypothetical protein